MEELSTNLFEYLKNHFEWVFIAIGLLFLIGSILDWDWIVLNPSSKVKNSFIGSFIIENWGRNGLRFIHGFLGVISIAGALLFLWLRK